MDNRYSINKDCIKIFAPGSSRTSRIKNDLLWEINQKLGRTFQLLSLHTTKSKVEGENVVACISVKSIIPKYLVLKKLDRMFIDTDSIDEAEARKLHAEIDPQMDYDVFKETCCVENVDMEYIAVNEDVFLRDLMAKSDSISSIKRYIKSTAPIYVSFFSNKEMTLLFNDLEMQKHVLPIVEKHCTRNSKSLSSQER